jgi:hypothetical protein
MGSTSLTLACCLAACPVEQFARLRRPSPVWWNPQDPDKGWGISRWRIDIEITGPLTRMRHGWINGIAALPVRFNAG